MYSSGIPLADEPDILTEAVRLECDLLLVTKHGADIVDISKDKTSISETPDVRFGVATNIVHCTPDHGTPPQDVVKTADVLTGNDRDCVNWIRNFRGPSATNEDDLPRHRSRCRTGSETPETVQ